MLLSFVVWGGGGSILKLPGYEAFSGIRELGISVAWPVEDIN